MAGGRGWRSKGCRYVHGDIAATGTEGSVTAENTGAHPSQLSLFLCRMVASLIPCFSVFFFQCLLSQAWSLCGASLCHAHLCLPQLHVSGKPQKGKLDRLRAEYKNYPCRKANDDAHLATELAGTLMMVTDQGDKMPLDGKEKKALSTDTT